MPHFFVNSNKKKMLARKSGSIFYKKRADFTDLTEILQTES